MNIRIFNPYEPQGEALDQRMASTAVGIVARHPDSGVAISYKVPHYLSFGLYFISMLTGELMEMLATRQCGSFYQAGAVAQHKEQIQQLVDEPELLKKGRAGALRLFEEQFESEAVHAKMAKWVAAEYRGTGTEKSSGVGCAAPQFGLPYFQVAFLGPGSSVCGHDYL